MPAFNYKKHLAPAVESGAKRQTIRARRRDGRDPRPGDRLYHYTGMRTHSCRKLREDVLQSRQRILIRHRADGSRMEVLIDGECLGDTQIKALATADGFTCAGEFFAFFRDEHGLPFEGYLYRW